MSKVLEVAEGDYAYTHDLPVEYETPEDAKRRQNRNTSRKSRAVANARQAGVSLYDPLRDTDGVEFDPTATTNTMLSVADGDYMYAYDLPVEYETPEDANRRRKRNSSRKSRVVASARQAGALLYAESRDLDGNEFDPGEPTSKMLRVAGGDPTEGLANVALEGVEGESALAPPADFWDRVADRVADRIAAKLFRQAPLA